MRRLFRRPAAATLTLLAFAAGAASAQVTLQQIMADPDWIGNQPEDPFWDDTGERVYFEQKRSGEKIRDLWRVGLDGGDLEPVPATELATFSRPGGDDDSTHSRRAFIHAGDLFVRDLGTDQGIDQSSGEVRQLTRTAAAESRPVFLAGDREIAFQRDDAWLAFDLESGLVRQLADLRTADDPAEENDDFDYLAAKQLRLYRKLAESKAEEEARREHERALERDDPARAPAPWYLGDGNEIVWQSLAPSGDHLLLVVRDEGDESGKRGTMPTYVTESGYVETREVRTRVNREPPRPQRLVLLDLASRERHDLDTAVLPGIDTDPLAEIRAEAIEWHVEKGGDREQVEKALTAPDTRPLTVGGIEWSTDGAKVAVQLHSIDNKDRWLATVDLETGELATQYRLTDPAWINWRYNEFGWAGDDRTLWFLSEADGTSHLYVKALDAPEPRQLTQGEFVVWDPRADRERRSVYYRANVEHPGVYEIWRTDLASGASEQLTVLGGMNDFRLSPDESRLLVMHSEIDRHTDLWVQENRPGAEARRLTSTVSEEFAAIDWVLPEIVEVPSSHVERSIYSKLYKPADLAPGSSPPAVVFVHGAGYLQNAHKGWAGYFREFMFHTLLVEHGYVVLDMDYRASAGYGRDWRTAIYRQMGYPELEDIQDGVDWLVAEHGVDRDRVGIYGGSYGGFMTFMALFRDPERFAAGASLRPVTDWAHYNHGYTSNILNTPEVDPMAYEKSSPIELAEGLSRPLLIAAGMQDDNVFFQDTVLLVQRLIELEKEDFETAFYPLDPHGFVHPESWLDEYRRIFKLFERYVRGAG